MMNTLIFFLFVLLTLPARTNDLPQRLAYLAPASSGADNVWLTEVPVADSPRLISDHAIDLYYYDIAADGSVVYAGRNEAGGISEIYYIQPDGQVVQLTNCRAENADCRRPAISPDGAIIAYERMTLGAEVEPPAVYRMNTAGELLDAVPIQGTRPFWLADGRLAVHTLDGSALLIDGERIPLPLDGPISFDTNGEILIAGPNPDCMRQRAIYRIDFPDNPPQRLYPLSDCDYADIAAYRRPGTEELVVLRHDGEVPGYQLHMVIGDGRAPRIIHSDAASTVIEAAWSPDGRWLAFVRAPLNGGGDPALWLYDAVTGRVQLLAESAHSPRWSPERSRS